MPHKEATSDGVRQQRRKGSDKARRSYELNGSYSSKHLRQREALAEKIAEQGRSARGPATASLGRG